MNAAFEAMTRAYTAELTLTVDGNTLKVKGPDPLPEKIIEELRANKPAVLETINGERRRDAACADTWNRLQETYSREGCPHADRWLTSDVRFAEYVVEQLWLSSREDSDDDRRFHAALERWERITTEAIGAAADAIP